MELELADDYSDAEILDRLSNATVPGLEFLRVDHVPQGVKKAQLRSSSYEMKLPPTRVRQAETQVSDLIAAESCLIERPRGGKTIDPRPHIEYLEIESGTLRMRLAVPAKGGASPRDVLIALGLQELEHEGCYLTRTEVELQP